MRPTCSAPPAPPTPDNYLPGDEVEVMACTVGGFLVRYSRQDPDSRPFAFAKCEDNIEENTPWGIADNCEPLQLVVNGAMRSFEDNKKLSANVITALKRRYIKGKMPEDITPGMKLELSEDCDDARKAIQSIVIPDVGESLVSLLTMAMPMLAPMDPRRVSAPRGSPRLNPRASKILPPSCTPTAAGIKNPRAVNSMASASRHRARPQLMGWPRSQKIR